jgi:transposase
MNCSIEYKEALAHATSFKHENPAEKQVTAARIYNVNENTIRTRMRRERQRQRTGAPIQQRGGHNKVLSEAQVSAIYKYVEDSYLGGYGATKQMLFATIGFLKEQEIPPQKPPSWRWFQQFLKAHPELFRTLKQKPIARIRVTAGDITQVTNWFGEWALFCIKHNIRPENILNFDEGGFRVGVAPGEEIIVPAYIVEVSIIQFN